MPGFIEGTLPNMVVSSVVHTNWRHVYSLPRATNPNIWPPDPSQFATPGATLEEQRMDRERYAMANVAAAERFSARVYPPKIKRISYNWSLLATGVNQMLDQDLQIGPAS